MIMNACIFSVGTELLMGSIVNTNTKYLSERLNELGINVLYHVSVGDNPKRLKEELDYYLSKVDLIITTGGLGPTQDDLTKEVISEYFGMELVTNESILEEIVEIFKSMNRNMTENNKKQALVPKGGKALRNRMGTAPGIFIEKNGKNVILLPGPPHEMKNLFEDHVFDILKSKDDKIISSMYIKVFGVGESKVEDMLKDLIDKQTCPTIATYAKMGEVEVRITAGGKNERENNILLEAMKDEIVSRLGKSIYSFTGESIQEAVGRMLIEKNISVSFAESCTGGLLSALITDVSGISKVFDRGVVTYSNESKMSELGVKKDTLDRYGAVSEETAIEMAKGLYDTTGSDICISVTGIAGPDGGSEQKPVGLVYIGVCYLGNCYAEKFNFRGNRSRIRNSSALNGFNLIRKTIDK